LYVAITVMKLTAYWFTGILALFAEGLHTLSDVAISGFLLIAIRYSRRGPDDDHPFGHGRAQHVAAVVAATLFISFTSFELLKDAIPRVIFREHAAHFPSSFEGKIALAVLGASLLIALWPLVALFRQKELGAAAKAQALEWINDILGLLAAGVGTSLAMAGISIADPIAAVVVALIIAANAVSIFRRSLSPLLGESPPPAIVARVCEIALQTKGVRGFHGFRAVQDGPSTFHADLHVEVDRGMMVEEAHAIADHVERSVMREFLGSRLTVHIDVHENS
jgi:ferrous-iron efflux pump FieF